MQLSQKQLADFKALYKKNFGKEISDAEALEQGINLVTLVKTICKTLHEHQSGDQECQTK